MTAIMYAAADHSSIPGWCTTAILILLLFIGLGVAITWPRDGD